MKSFQLLITCLLFSIATLSQPKRFVISDIFSNRNNIDFRFNNGYDMQSFKYYLSHDTLFYSNNNFYEYTIPLRSIDFSTYIIERDTRWMTEQKENIFHLILKSSNGKKFPDPFFKIVTTGKDSISLLFPTQSMAMEALEYLKSAASVQQTSSHENNNEKLFRKIFANKDDVDFEFTVTNGYPSPFKYYLHNDSLWVYGTEIYAIVIPLNAIDFDKTFVYESGVWTTNNKNKCAEIAIYAIKGKLFRQDFSDPDGYKAPFEKDLGGKKIDFATLVLPDKSLAEQMIKYLKTQKH